MTNSRRRLDLSVIQVAASVLAAVTATVAASYLGVAGTVIGAAVASGVAAVANAVYGHSLHRTRERVRTVRGLPPMPIAVQGPPQLPPVTTPPRLRRFALVAVSLFAMVLAVVTGFEAIAGRPLADLLRGDTGSGTTLFGADAASTRTRQPSPAQTVTVTQSVVVTTPTVTRTAPAVTETSTPTVTTTPSSAPATSPSTSTSPSASSTP
jgi:hypothetical protein